MSAEINAEDCVQVNTNYEDYNICPKCGAENLTSETASCAGYVSEVETACTHCGHWDYWAYGFYMSQSEAGAAAKENEK